MSKILVTGAAGFIGFHFSRRLVERGSEVVGRDSLNDSYAVQLKQYRRKELACHARFRCLKLDITRPRAQARTNHQEDQSQGLRE